MMNTLSQKMSMMLGRKWSRISKATNHRLARGTFNHCHFSFHLEIRSKIVSLLSAFCLSFLLTLT